MLLRPGGGVNTLDFSGLPSDDPVTVTPAIIPPMPTGDILVGDTLGVGRRLEIEGAFNVRDIGGYTTETGRRTRARMFLRADDLSRLSPSAQQALIDYGVRTVIDLRKTGEVEGCPDVFSGSSDIVYRHINMIGDSDDSGIRRSGGIVERIQRSYTSWLDLRQPQIRDILAVMAEPEAQPVLYHCAGGKDRTGVISALLLGLAKVPDDTIAEDYALTGRYIWDRFLAYPEESDVPTRFADWEEYQHEACPHGVMLKVLEHIRDRYGGVDVYCRTVGLAGDQIASLYNAVVE